MLVHTSVSWFQRKRKYKRAASQIVNKSVAAVVSGTCPLLSAVCLVASTTPSRSNRQKFIDIRVRYDCLVFSTLKNKDLFSNNALVLSKVSVMLHLKKLQNHCFGKNLEMEPIGEVELLCVNINEITNLSDLRYQKM